MPLLAFTHNFGKKRYINTGAWKFGATYTFKQNKDPYSHWSLYPLSQRQLYQQWRGPLRDSNIRPMLPGGSEGKVASLHGDPWVYPVGSERSLREEMATTQYCYLKIHGMRSPGCWPTNQSMGLQQSRYDSHLASLTRILEDEKCYKHTHIHKNCRF